MEHDHPHALEFLRKDCSNVNGGSESGRAGTNRFRVVMWVSVFLDFFVKHGVAVMTVRELFDFVTDPSITSRNMEQYLDKVSRTQQNLFPNLAAERKPILSDGPVRPW